MIVDFGLAFIVIWLFNLGYILWEFFKHTPNWKDDNVDTDEIVQNFMMNTPIEKIELIKNIATINPMLFLTGISLLIIAI